MNDIFKKKQKKGINPVVAAVAGVAVGVGAAVAASEALKDKKNRKMVNNFMSDVKDMAIDAKEKAADYFDKEDKKSKVKKAVKKVEKTKSIN